MRPKKPTTRRSCSRGIVRMPAVWPPFGTVHCAAGQRAAARYSGVLLSTSLRAAWMSIIGRGPMWAM
ncbi:MAG: hypothetical protein H0W96_13280 [Solirubrobacterales bacterium]|nr:hypothetical protein [Solirubrobacterales bacterium]